MILKQGSEVFATASKCSLQILEWTKTIKPSRTKGKCNTLWHRNLKSSTIKETSTRLISFGLFKFNEWSAVSNSDGIACFASWPKSCCSSAWSSLVSSERTLILVPGLVSAKIRFGFHKPFIMQPCSVSRFRTIFKPYIFKNTICVPMVSLSHASFSLWHLYGKSAGPNATKWGVIF